MFIEIKGISFVNQGAVLMLHAVLQKVGSRIPRAKFVVVPWKDTPFEKRASFGLYQKIELSKFGIRLGGVLECLPRRWRGLYGLVSQKEIEVVFDASGFTYSDQWGPQSSIFMAKNCRAWKKLGIKTILLPQAFGPFTSPEIKKAFKRVVETVDLVYARDKVSYDYIAELTGTRPNVKIAPDFTILVDGVLPEYFKGKNDKICVVPNYRMIDMPPRAEGERYLPFMVNCVERLIEKGEDVFVLVQEGEKDLLLARQIVERIRIQKPIEIINETDALKIKGIIGECKSVLSSRFHGLVSALSQGIPSLCTGWSHKYKALLEDYSFPEGFLSVSSTQEEIKHAIDLITEESSRSRAKERLVNAAEKQKILVEEMWGEIFKELGCHSFNR